MIGNIPYILLPRLNYLYMKLWGWFVLQLALLLEASVVLSKKHDRATVVRAVRAFVHTTCALSASWNWCLYDLLFAESPCWTKTNGTLKWFFVLHAALRAYKLLYMGKWSTKSAIKTAFLLTMGLSTLKLQNGSYFTAFGVLELFRGYKGVELAFKIVADQPRCLCVRLLEKIAACVKTLRLSAMLLVQLMLVYKELCENDTYLFGVVYISTLYQMLL